MPWPRLKKERDLRSGMVLYVAFSALLWSIWGVDYAYTGFRYPWPLYWMVGTLVVIAGRQLRHAGNGDHLRAPWAAVGPPPGGYRPLMGGPDPSART